MPASAEQPAPRVDAPHPWRPASVVFLAVSLAALAAGAFPEWFLPPDRAREFAAPPAMGLMLAAQVTFVLLFCALLIRRRDERPVGRYLVDSVVEYAVLVAASVPLYVLAAWLSDGAARDVARCLLYLTAVVAAAWGLAQWADPRRPAFMTAVALVAAAVALGGPVACYLLAELADSPPGAAWLRRAAPAVFAVGLAGRGPGLLPQPLWAWLLWPAAGALAAVARTLVPRGAPGT